MAIFYNVCKSLGPRDQLHTTLAFLILASSWYGLVIEGHMLKLNQGQGTVCTYIGSLTAMVANTSKATHRGSKECLCDGA
jgi:hypothetical protein